MVISALVGGAHMSFYRQCAAAGLNDRRSRLPPPPSASATSSSLISAEEGNGLLAGLFLLRGGRQPGQQGLPGEADQEARRQAPRTERTRHALLRGRDAVGGGVKKAGSIDRDAVADALRTGISYRWSVRHGHDRPEDATTASRTSIWASSRTRSSTIVESLRGAAAGGHAARLRPRQEPEPVNLLLRKRSGGGRHRVSGRRNDQGPRGSTPVGLRRLASVLQLAFIDRQPGADHGSGSRSSSG